MKTKIILLLVILIISCRKSSVSSNPHNIEQWMGIYIKQEKIGYSFLRLEKVNGYYKLTNRIKINLKMMGQEEEIVSSFSGLVNPDYALKNFEFSFNSRGRVFSATGQVENGLLNIEVNSAGTVKRIQSNANFPIYPSPVLGTVAIKKRFPIGKEQSVKTFDATTLSIIDAKIKILGKELIALGEKNYNLYKVEITMLGLKTITWVDENGISKKELSPPEMVMVEETYEQALSQEKSFGKIDILSLFSIAVDTVIANPRALKYLKLKLTNADLTGLAIADENQRIIQEQPLIVEITTPDITFAKNLMLPIREQQGLLKPSIYIQSDDAMIKKTANKIIGQETDVLKITRNIMQWVYTNIKKRATASLPSAVDVLKNLEGDCNEHAVLFAALSRTVGIPCQICVGLVYADGRFAYHAWNKVYLGKWIMVDPTFGQLPADATHIKLSEGELEEQAKVLKIVGKAKIVILEYY
ncbi:MAG: transglutaminase-like domain-containing protein [candidate division WOR-3 bacterium]